MIYNLLNSVFCVKEFNCEVLFKKKPKQTILIVFKENDIGRAVVSVIPKVSEKKKWYHAGVFPPKIILIMIYEEFEGGVGGVSIN